jgi:hypothetical protein
MLIERSSPVAVARPFPSGVVQAFRPACTHYTSVKCSAVYFSASLK